MKPDIIKISTITENIPPVIKVDGKVFKTYTNSDVIIQVK